MYFYCIIKNTIRYIIIRGIIPFICTLVFCINSNAQLNANFQADQLIGCPPFLVQFSDLSTGSPSSFFWDLGNGTTSTQQNPGTIYFNPGLYTVKLIIRNGTAVDSLIKTQYIFVSNVPGASFIVSDSVGCSPFLIQFNDLSTAGSGTITSWEWDFGDGTTSSIQSPQHIYSVAGNFTITLKVTNSNGCITVLTKPGFIHIDPSPLADFTSSSSSGCSPPVSINFTNTTTGSYSASVWDFGDGTNSSLTNPSHNYNAAGTFDVSLIVNNNFGCSDTVSKVTVIGAVSVDFTVPDSICEGTPVSFINTSSGSISSSWSFGDGSKSVVANPVKIFNNPGIFTVKLVNNFGGCIDSISKPVTVVQKPIANFTFTSPPAGCTTPITVTFKSTSSGAVSYLWNFGDGTTSSVANPSHTYTTLGSFTVSLLISNSKGCTDTITKQGIISILPPNIDTINNLPFKGCIPHTQQFTANITTPEPIQTYLWNFGDGTTSSLSSPSHTYSVEGIFNVSLKITTVNGCIDTFTYRGAIIVGSKPVANFSATPRVSCAHDLIQFTDLSNGTVNIWNWQFGDQGSSSEQNPNYHYIDTGFFNVTLIVGNYYCYDTIVKQNYVYIKPPIARSEIQFNCSTPFTRKFFDRSIAALTTNWDFGDGTSSTAANPVHTYATSGIFYIKLRVTNGSCFDEKIDTINIIDENPNFTNDSLVCRNSPATFMVTNANTTNIYTYTWIFGDGSPIITTTLPIVFKKFFTSGIYSPTLVTTDLNGCKDTIKHTASIKILGPKAGFTNPSGACVNTNTTFTDATVPFGNFPIVSWMWSWGDGKADTFSITPFKHIYTTPGKYNVRLIVIDAYGCRDTLFKQNAIQVTRPSASFTIADSIFCKNTNIQFTSTSIGTNLSYLWTFGDGNTSSISNPAHAYSVPGNYQIILKVTDRYGCTDTTSLSSGIVIGNPIASFLMSDSFISCPPAQITFFNTSSFSNSVKWDFDDGNFSNLDTPSHFFKTAKTYNIKLVVQGFGSCKDSLTKTLQVKGPSGSFSYSPLAKCVPASINFSATATNNQYFVWDFGDGTTDVSTSSTATHIYMTQGKFVPKLLLQDTTLNCIVPVIGTDTIFVTGALSNIKNFPPAFCDSATIRFFDSSLVRFDTISGYLWTFSDGATSNQVNPLHKFVSAGNYTITLKVTTLAGCSDSITKSLRIVASPIVSIIGKDTACVYDSISFSGALAVADTSILQWSFTFGNGTSSNLQSPPPVSYLSPGPKTIRVRVTNTTGCTDTASKRIVVFPLPNVDAGLDSTICRGKSLNLIPSGAVSYVWQSDPTLSCTNCISPVASPIDTMVIYRVTGANLSGCKNRDSVIVRVTQPFAIKVDAGQNLCKGQKVTLHVSGTDNYSWTPTVSLDNPISANPVAAPDTTTIYTVVGQDNAKCFKDTATVPIRVFPIPVFNIIPDNLSVAIGNSVTLTTSNSADITSWQWTPSLFLSCANCAQPVSTPTNSIVYKAVASNAGGCIAVDMVTIEITCSSGNLYVPNTFSPNNDGSNDVFYPRGKGLAGIKFFRIFNRWGTVVFQKDNFAANDESAGWDGTFKGQALTPDVFVYQIEVICGNGQPFVSKGNVTLIR